ncbi:LysM peptidoglycan-binding domain-containing protein [Streptococcus devriesei]|uniref:aggregation-promoting factor n=1 Tax=Streptococcus devriesei TaxID=231233 RepID=UPI0003FE1623|nr:LysM peptidoglycan-binding domain-containing protein [Streptococcus devriesei]
MSLKNILENKSKTIKTSVAGIATAASLILPIAAHAESYTVKSGDTLSEIASTHKTTVKKLAKINKIKDVHLIYTDQVLELDETATPQAAEETAPAASAETQAPAVSETSQTAETTVQSPAAETSASEATTSAAPAATQVSEATTAAPEVPQTTEATTAAPAEAQTKETTAASTSNSLSASDAAAKEFIAQKESGGNYSAQNGQYYGRYQLSSSYLNGDLSAENQERVANAYVTSRYGSWTAAQAFWNANGWY